MGSGVGGNMSYKKGHGHLSPGEKKRLGKEPREVHLSLQKNLGEHFLHGFFAISGCVYFYSLGSAQSEAAESLSAH